MGRLGWTFACFVLEGVDDERGEEVIGVRLGEELLAFLVEVDGDFVGVVECGEWRGLEGVARGVVEQDVDERKVPWLRQEEKGACSGVAGTVEEEAYALGDNGGGPFFEVIILRGGEVYCGDASGADLVVESVEDGVAQQVLWFDGLVWVVGGVEEAVEDVVVVLRDE